MDRYYAVGIQYKSEIVRILICFKLFKIKLWIVFVYPHCVSVSTVTVLKILIYHAIKNNQLYLLYWEVFYRSIFFKEN